MATLQGLPFIFLRFLMWRKAICRYFNRHYWWRKTLIRKNDWWLEWLEWLVPLCCLLKSSRNYERQRPITAYALNISLPARRVFCTPALDDLGIVCRLRNNTMIVLRIYVYLSILICMNNIIELCLFVLYNVNSKHEEFIWYALVIRDGH